MESFRRDHFREDPTLALKIAYKIAHRYCTLGSPEAEERLPARQTISYDLHIDDDEISKAELWEEPDDNESFNPGSGQSSFPDRRVSITYGGGPRITLEVDYGEELNQHSTNSYYRRRSRSFAPKSYSDDELVHCRIGQNQLEDWFFKFVPGDSTKIKAQDDIRFVTGGTGHNQLKERVADYLEGLPRKEADCGTVGQNAVFEPHYIGNLLSIAHWYARPICRELAREGRWPVVKLDPPEDNHFFELDEFVIGHEAHWRGYEEYDYSTWKFRSASKMTNDKIRVV